MVNPTASNDGSDKRYRDADHCAEPMLKSRDLDSAKQIVTENSRDQ